LRRPVAAPQRAVPVPIKVADARTAAGDLVRKFSEGGPHRLIGAELANPPRYLSEFFFNGRLGRHVLVPWYCTNIQYSDDNGPMENVPASLWIAACAHRLQQQWHTVDPLELEDVARDLWRDERLRAMQPDEAAVDWLKPITETT
jgi:hypothetical protein